MPQSIAYKTLGDHKPLAWDHGINSGLLTARDNEITPRWITQPTTDVDEELFISPTTVVWSIHGEIKRFWTYEEEGEDVIDACFAWFPSIEEEEAPVFETNSTGAGGRRRGEKKKETKLERGLVVLLKSIGFIYLLGGSTHIIHIPFEVKHAFPAPVGIILERKLGAHELQPHPKKGSTLWPDETETELGGGGRFPKFFTLTSPLNEFGIVTLTAAGQGESEFGLEDEMVYIDAAIALTRNQRTGTVTLFRATYPSSTIPSGSARPPPTTTTTTAAGGRRRGDTHSRRKSSMGGASFFLESEHQHRRRSSFADIGGLSSSFTLDRGMGTQIAEFEAKMFATGSLDTETLLRELELAPLETFPISEVGEVFAIQARSGVRVVCVPSGEEKVLCLMVKVEQGFVPFVVDMEMVEARGAVPIRIDGDEEGFGVERVLVVGMGGEVRLWSPYSPPIRIQTPHGEGEGEGDAVVGVSHPAGDRVTLRRASGKAERIRIEIGTKSDAVRACLGALDCVLGREVWEGVWGRYICLKEEGGGLGLGEWDAVGVVVCMVFMGGEERRHIEVEEGEVRMEVDGGDGDGVRAWYEMPGPLRRDRLLRFAARAEAELRDEPMEGCSHLLKEVLLALHLLAEDWKLDIIYADEAARLLTPLLLQLATWLGWSKWVEYYMDTDGEMEGPGLVVDGYRLRNTRVEEVGEVPSIYGWCVGAVEGTGALGAYPSFRDLVRRERDTKAIVAAGKLCQKTQRVVKLYSILASPEGTFEDVVKCLVEYGMTKADLSRLPVGMSVPLLEAIAQCQVNPPKEWGAEALELIGRKDLRNLVKPDYTGFAHAAKEKEPEVRDIKTIVQSINEAESKEEGLAEVDTNAVTRLLFREDRRLQEVTKLLRTSKPLIVIMDNPPEMNEHDVMQAQQNAARQIAVRSLAVPTGRGIYTFSSKKPVLTEKFPIPAFNWSVKVKPSNTAVTVDKTFLTEERLAWGLFHNGAAAALSISRETEGINTSWIVFNKPTELTVRHAGFLLGLGLNGHLKDLATWHAFNYLTSKHTMTSIGLLLGLAVSYLGTMDATVTRLLSVHVLALLPAGSTELNLSPLTQTAGLMGIGLLYHGTQQRRMTEVMLAEIGKSEAHHGLANFTRDEGYRLAAGFALGFINLGQGRDLKGLKDLRITDKLITYMASLDDGAGCIGFSTPGAVVALALIWLKTSDANVAAKVDVPDTQSLLDSTRPDFLLLRVMAKNLILWDSVRGSMEWVDAQLPACLMKHAGLRRARVLTTDDLSLYSIIAGACFSIGLRYAGSGNEEARDTLIYYLDRYMQLASMAATTHDQKMCRTTVRNFQDVIAVSAVCVMAGTGDLDVMRRLRRLHSRADEDVVYGSHMAAHMGLGILFMGGGRYSLSTSNLAIASLLAALYPIWPNAPTDNTCHLQALRHLWVLAADARCLVPRDVDTRQPTVLPVRIPVQRGDGTVEVLQRTAPCLLPELQTVPEVSSDSNEFWSTRLDLRDNPEHLKNFQKSQTIFVAKKQDTLEAKANLRPEEDEMESSWIWQQFEEKLKDCPFITKSDIRELVRKSDPSKPGYAKGLFERSMTSLKLNLDLSDLDKITTSRLWNVKLVIAMAQSIERRMVNRQVRAEGMKCLPEEFVERLRLQVWRIGERLEAEMEE
ncbi:Anaphase-promoting complex subunit 1 [Saitoella coloradoensis]